MSLEVLVGGKDPQVYNQYRFIEGLVTDTRLMGVIGLFAHWELSLDKAAPQQLYQFYYFDVEEYGLDYVRLLTLDNAFEAQIALRSSFGCLGARFSQVSEKECRYLADYFVEDTKKRNKPLPKEVDNIGFVLCSTPELSEEEKKALFEKTCVNVESPYGLVNYYLMRNFAKDEEGMEHLKCKDVPEESFEDVSLPEQASFMKNSIREFEEADGSISYVSQSILETEDDYHLVVTEAAVKDNKISSIKKISQMVISLDEASLNLDTEEFVNVYEILCSADYFDSKFKIMTLGSQVSNHEAGRLYMEYKDDNKHVEKQNFRLSDDVNAVYYVTEYGQLIVVAYSLDSLKNLDSQIQSFLGYECVCPASSYHFENSVIYDFIQSDYVTFEEFAEEYE